MLATMTRGLTSHGFPVNTRPEVFGELRTSNAILDDPAALHERMDQDGYLFLRDVLDRDLIMRARRELLEKLATIGEIDCNYPLLDAVSSGESLRSTVDIKAFLHDLRTGPQLRQLAHTGAVIDFYTHFLGGPVLPFTYIWVRPVRPGRATGCHIDWVYMGRGTRNLYTSWIPIGDVPVEDGTLMILEGSHKKDETLRHYRALDVDRDQDTRYSGGWFGKDPMAVREQVGGRWLTTAMHAGDMLLFTPFTMHCSLDNQSPQNHLRLSSDTRYQLASEPADERWVGEHPIGHTAFGSKPAASAKN